MLPCQKYLQTVLEQIKAIRDTGATNMLDQQTVQYLAFKFQFYEAVLWIEEAPSELYWRMLTETDWGNVESILTEEQMELARMDRW